MTANQNPQQKKERSNEEPSTNQPIIDIDAWNKYYDYMFRGLPSPQPTSPPQTGSKMPCQK